MVKPELNCPFFIKHAPYRPTLTFLFWDQNRFTSDKPHFPRLKNKDLNGDEHG